MNSGYIGSSIKEMREVRKMSQEALSRATGLSIATVRRLEMGKHKGGCRIDVLQRVCKALDCSCGDLLDIDVME